MEVFSAVADLPENSVEYYIFVADDPTAGCSKEQSLVEIDTKAKELYTPWIAEYIWQRQGFSLRLSDVSEEPCLRGFTEFADCMDDEWLIVYILREISKAFPNTFVRVLDNDGEFLLIEAANAIPNWLNPDNADNRVWIHKGDVCIIAVDNEDQTQPLTVTEALEVLNTQPAALYRPMLLQKEAFARLEAYPQAAKDHIHRARIVVPRKVAQILHLNPSYIAPASEAFLQRDPISMKVCNTMANFPPEDSVSCVVKFTRLIYAQLKSQRLLPLKKFKIPRPNESGYDMAELGMKVACGFELLCAGSGKLTARQRKDLTTHPKFQQYLGMLETEGYFKEETPGTPLYHKLVAQAKETFADMEDDSYNASQIGQTICETLGKLGNLSDEEIASWDDHVDSDKWMDVDFSELENMMDGKGVFSADDDDEDLGRATEEILQSQEKIKNLVGRLRSFMDDEKAGLDGVEFDDDDLSDASDNTEGGQRIEEIGSENEADNDDDIDEDDFLEFFLKEALNLSPEEIEQYRADPSAPETDKGKGRATKDDKIRAELVSHGVVEEDDGDDFEILKNLIDSIKSQEGGSGPGSNLLARLGMSNV